MSHAHLPASARLALWLAAWSEGRASPDALVISVHGPDAAHHVTGLPDEPDAIPLVLALGVLRRLGTTGARLAMPVPGDPVGLGGPPGFNAEALETGEAVILPGSGFGLVPMRAGAGVVWRALPANPGTHVQDFDEAATGLRQALVTTTERLVALDVARWRPEIADTLMELHSRQPPPVPPGYDSGRLETLVRAQLCLEIVALARETDGGAASLSEIESRRAALDPVDRAARHALVACCS